MQQSNRTISFVPVAVIAWDKSCQLGGSTVQNFLKPESPDSKGLLELKAKSYKTEEVPHGFVKTGKDSAVMFDLSHRD